MKKLIVITFFAIAMGFLESAVVVYLRELYYPNGFRFPLSSMQGTIVTTELWREFATLIMLIAVGYLASNLNAKRFAWFIYSFAIWDICYYVFLYLLLGWPASMFEWDVLFLLPVMWTGPVYTPLLICVSMITLSLFILLNKSTFNKLNMRFMLSGTILCLLAFMQEFTLFHWALNNSIFDMKALIDSGYRFIPKDFPLALFLLGYMLLNTGIFLTIQTKIKPNNNKHVPLFI